MSDKTKEVADTKPAGGVNIKKRLLTAGILIPAVCFAT
jgi:hypothetical protein